MLIAFAVTNHACFRDRQELSAEAPQRSDDSRSFATGVPRSPRLNRVTAIYGPNGSGKSRLAQAFRVAQKLVVHSAKESQAGEAIPYTPFLFDDTSDKQPTTFEISFIQEQVVYEYIFSIDRKRVHE